MFEVESKYPVVDPTELQRRLVALGAQPGEPIVQIDQYYAHPARDFAATDEALRIRRVGEANYVTYKGPKIDPVTKTRREIEIALAPGDEAAAKFAALLAALGFMPVAEVHKRRLPLALVWQGRQLEAALDDVQELGTFVELELAADESQLDDARRAIAALAEQLGLQESERRSYLELLLK